MNKNKILESMELLDEKYVEEADPFNARPMTSIRKKLAARWISVVACFCILTVLSVNALLPFLKRWSLTELPIYDNAVYSASDIETLFFGGENGLKGGTSSYTKIYVPSSDHFTVYPIPTEEYIAIYENKNLKKSLSKSEFSDFTDPIVSRFANAINENVPSYDMKKVTSSYQDDSLEVYISELGQHAVLAWQTQSYNLIRLYSHSSVNPTESMSLYGVNIEVDQTKSDSEIISSLSDIKEKLFYIFGVEFTDTKIVRKYDSYSEHGAEWLYVYFYNESDHPLNSNTDKPISDHIVISFDKRVNMDGDIISDTVLTNVSISYLQNRIDSKYSYAASKKVRMISLEDAEKLLYKGYVFGAHSCHLCMAMQDKVNFKDYDFVGMTYLFSYDENENKTECIPFYTFYKNIGTSENGNLIYAQTYVPAIEVSGYEEYFESQKGDHTFE